MLEGVNQCCLAQTMFVSAHFLPTQSHWQDDFFSPKDLYLRVWQIGGIQSNWICEKKPQTNVIKFQMKTLSHSKHQEWFRYKGFGFDFRVPAFNSSNQLIII